MRKHKAVPNAEYGGTCCPWPHPAAPFRSHPAPLRMPRMTSSDSGKDLPVVQEQQSHPAHPETASGAAGPDPDAFRLLADSIPVLCWMADAQWRLIWCNRRWHEYCGTTHEQVAGWGWKSLLEPGVAPGVFEGWQASAAECVPFELTVPLRGADGECRPFLMRAEPVLDGEGRIERWYGTNTEISSAVEAEQQARAEAEQSRLDAERVQLALASGAIIGTWFWDLVAGRFTVDEPFAHAFGIDPVLGREGLSLDQVIANVHPDDKTGLVAAITAAIERGGRYSHQYRVRNLAGDYRWIEANGEVRKDDQGVSVSFPGVLLDVEQRRAAEAERLKALADLRASEARFRAAVEAVDGVLWTNNARGEMVGEQPGWAALTGQTYDEYRGFGWADAVHPDDAGPSVEAWLANLPSKQQFRFEHRVRRRDGAWRTFTIRAIPVLDETGEVVEWVGVHTDVTNERAVTAVLAENRSLLAAIGNSVPDAIFAKDPHGTIIYANRTYAGIVGRPLRDIVGHDEREWIAPDEYAAIARNDVRALAGEVVTADEVFTAPEGRTRVYESVKAPLVSSGGDTVGIVSVTADVSAERAALERERLLTREVDHRARNLLAIVQAVVQLSNGDTIAAYKDAITGRIRALGRAHSLLAESRWDGADLNELVHNELDPYRGARNRVVTCSGPALVLKPAAAQSLSLAIHELCANAAKYGALSADGGVLDVSWRLADGPGSRLEVHWRESGGPGIAAPPGRSGFGSSLIRSSIRGQLGGSVEWHWRPEGLECVIVLPGDHVAGAVAASG